MKISAGGIMFTAVVCIICLVGILLLQPSSRVVTKVHADQGVCSLESVKGAYAFHSQGNVATGQSGFPLGPIGEVGMVTADGSGNFTGQTTVNFNGLAVPLPDNGTYTVAPDCTVDFFIAAPFGTFHLHGVAIEGGKEFFLISVNGPGFFISSDGKRL